MSTKFALILVATLAVACGGATSPATSRPSSQQAPSVSGPTQPTAGAPALEPEPGESITGEQIVGAYEALNALDSWTFEATFWNKGFETNFEQSVEGTERRQPDVAVAATHTSANGDFRFVRIGDDVWTTLGANEFTHFDAADSENLLDQYEPFYIAALLSPVDSPQLNFDPIAVEQLAGVATTHYTLSDNDRENAVQLLDIDPSLWAGDVWIANDGGFLVALAWGPQSVENAQPIQGFRYDVTSVNCDCPIEAPE